MKKSLTGMTIIYAIMVAMIVTGLSLLLITYNGFEKRMISEVTRDVVETSYVHQGLAWLCDTTVAYGREYTMDLEDDRKLKLCKKYWGAFDICYSSLNTGETNRGVKVGMVGLSKNVADSSALVLGASGSKAYIGKDVFINGYCVVPKGRLESYGLKKAHDIPARVMPATFDMPLLELGSRLAALHTFRDLTGNSKIIVVDTLTASFLDTTTVIKADTIRIVGYVSGNVVLSALHLIIQSNAMIEDAIMLARKISVDSGFVGSGQLFATDTVALGKNVHLKYPSVIGLMPALEKNGPIVSYLLASDSCEIVGDVYLLSSGRSYPNVMGVFRNMTLTGGVYSEGLIQFSGYCAGKIVSNKIGNVNVRQENFLSGVKIDIDAMPEYYSHGLMFPNVHSFKIVKWLK